MGPVISSTVDMAMSFLKMGIRLLIVGASVFAFLAFMGIVISYIAIGINLTVLTDVFSMVQMWLPFDLNVILLWITTSCTAYILYRLSRIAIDYVNAVVGDA